MLQGCRSGPCAKGQFILQNLAQASQSSICSYESPGPTSRIRSAGEPVTFIWYGPSEAVPIMLCRDMSTSPLRQL